MLLCLRSTQPKRRPLAASLFQQATLLVSSSRQFVQFYPALLAAFLVLFSLTMDLRQIRDVSVMNESQGFQRFANMVCLGQTARNASGDSEPATPGALGKSSKLASEANAERYTSCPIIEKYQSITTDTSLLTMDSSCRNFRISDERFEDSSRNATIWIQALVVKPGATIDAIMESRGQNR
jgi:hypothetical protein